MGLWVNWGSVPGAQIVLQHAGLCCHPIPRSVCFLQPICGLVPVIQTALPTNLYPALSLGPSRLPTPTPHQNPRAYISWTRTSRTSPSLVIPRCCAARACPAGRFCCGTTPTSTPSRLGPPQPQAGQGKKVRPLRMRSQRGQGNLLPLGKRTASGVVCTLPVKRSLGDCISLAPADWAWFFHGAYWPPSPPNQPETSGPVPHKSPARWLLGRVLLVV